MIPRQPGQAGTIGTQTRRRVKVVTGYQCVHIFTTIQRYANERIYCLSLLVGMVFANTYQASTFPIDGAIGITALPRFSNWRRLFSRTNAIKTLIGKIREVDSAFMHHITATAVFMYQCAGIKRLRNNIANRAIVPAAFDYSMAPAFCWSSLYPVNIAMIKRHFHQTNCG